MLIHPVLENIEDPELDWLCVLFTEPLQVLKRQKPLEHRIRVNSKTTEFDLSNYSQLRPLQFIETLLKTPFKSMITLFVQV